MPDPAGEGGTVICQELDAQSETVCFALFDPQQVADGPVARLYLDEPVPLMFHASFHGR